MLNDTERKIFDALEEDVCSHCPSLNGTCVDLNGRCWDMLERQAHLIYERVIAPSLPYYEA